MADMYGDVCLNCLVWAIIKRVESINNCPDCNVEKNKIRISKSNIDINAQKLL